MDDKDLLDIYTDYLISSFGLTTQTGLSRLLNGAISHDRIQRFLAKEAKTGKDLWLTSFWLKHAGGSSKSRRLSRG